MDVKNAFLHGQLDELVFSQQPAGFVDAARPQHVCQLQRSLYGLKQAPRAWFTRFTDHLRLLGFTASRCDSSLFILRRGTDVAYLLLYVDDIILTSSSSSLRHSIIQSLHKEFAMTDLGDLHHFLGINVRRALPVTAAVRPRAPGPRRHARVQTHQYTGGCQGQTICY